MALKDILEAARLDIAEAMAVPELGARTFARVFYIAQRAEAMACAEDRADELPVQTRCLSELEGKARRTCEAIKESLTGGNHLVKEALRKLEADRKLVLEAGRELRQAETALNTRTLALGSGRPAGHLRLAENAPARGQQEAPYAEATSMDNTRGQSPRTDDDELEGEFVEEELPPIRPVKLDLPRDPELDADEEIDTENAHRKLDISDSKNGFRF